MQKTLTVSEAATRLGITRQAVLVRINTGKIPAHKISTGKTSPYLIKASDLPDPPTAA